jgi:hypothetical protein
MDSLSRNILSVFLPFSVLFSKPSWKKAVTLMNGALFDFPAEKLPGQIGRTAKKGVKLKNFKQMLSLEGAYYIFRYVESRAHGDMER